MAHVPPFEPQHLEAICRVLADTTDGLTGTEIGRVLQQLPIPDPDPANTKWKRLYNALASYQNERGFGNHVVKFIKLAMAPVHYAGRHDVFIARKDRLNEVLAFCGMHLRDDGLPRRVPAAQSLSEAAQRANSLKAKLLARGVHDDVLAFCRSELLQLNYFHAVFEAIKSVAAKLRVLSSLDGDGAQLVQDVLGGSAPPIIINDYATTSDRSEQRGFVNLLVGLFGAVRNPLAHRTRLEWPMSEPDALDILTLTSYIHRKLDSAKPRERED